MMKRILLINGPARSGKDTLAGLLLQHQVVRPETTGVYKFATRLKEMTHAAHGFPSARADAFEQVKDDLTWGPRRGITWRQAYIKMSEAYMKPLFGQDVFGQLLREQIELAEQARDHDTALVTDSGFAPEAEVLVNRWPGAIRLVRLVREGYDFTGDSRGYIKLAGVPMLEVVAKDMTELTAAAKNPALREFLA